MKIFDSKYGESVSIGMAIQFYSLLRSLSSIIRMSLYEYRKNFICGGYIE